MSDDFQCTIGFGDTFGTRAEISVLPEDEDGPPTIHFSVLAGQSGGHGMPNAAAARQIAAALLDAAEHAEKETAA